MADRWEVRQRQGGTKATGLGQEIPTRDLMSTSVKLHFPAHINSFSGVTQGNLIS